MMELEIKGKVYQFNFGMGFLREINKTVNAPMNGLNAKKNMGLKYMVAGLMDGEPDTLVEVLEAANKGQSPRVTRDLLDTYIDDENTDLDALFAEVLDFLKRTNATKKAVADLEKMMEDQAKE